MTGKWLNSAGARWMVLLIVSLTMMLGYVVAKEMTPLQFLLEAPLSEGGLGWTSSEFGLFAGSKGFFNVFLLMLFVSGIVLDRFGVRIAGIISCLLMLVGAGFIYYATCHTSPAAMVHLPFSFGFLESGEVKRQVLMASGGFATFGVGYELCGITVSKVIVKWFSGKELALAMGLQVAMARLGTAAALAGSPALGHRFGLATPLLVGLWGIGIGLVLYLVYCSMDRRDMAEVKSDDEQFRWGELLLTFKNKGFWLITLLCLLYYSSLYPFLDFATKLMISKYGVDPELAGTIPAILPFTSIILTPLFGAMYDKFGHGTQIMILGTAMLTVVLAGFALPLSSPGFAVTLMFVLGIAFSLLPSVLWPAVPKLVPMAQLGTAYSMIYYIQNIGLFIIPIVIGSVLHHNTVGESVDYTAAMWIFTGIGVAGIIVAAMLHRHVGRHPEALA